ncbi:unknown [Singapore grouper iridovirus]|uniref:Uncharacterized protein n=1 Tax=Singapore grouper iridovirus TaxID=262968 RepID=Q5YFH0_9VIRU|nr:hypothetical protein ORF095R [Singapore grouper iridovirus]AAS18110.1 unknown [Singapore grouper iridovirus]WAU86804.1 hypothetical protein ORF095R [Singapore grouper iridovirus]
MYLALCLLCFVVDFTTANCGDNGTNCSIAHPPITQSPRAFDCGGNGTNCGLNTNSSDTRANETNGELSSTPPPTTIIPTTIAPPPVPIDVSLNGNSTRRPLKTNKPSNGPSVFAFGERHPPPTPDPSFPNDEYTSHCTKCTCICNSCGPIGTLVADYM